MNSEARKDELRMSWNKKVSLREITQFYEDKLRELDAKQTKLIEDINKKEAEFESKMQVLENSIEEVKDFMQNIDAYKKIIEDRLENSVKINEIENELHVSKSLWKRESKRIEELENFLHNVHTDLVRAVMNIAVNYSLLQFVQDLAMTALQVADKDILQFELEMSKGPASFENIYIHDAKIHVKEILKAFKMFESNLPDDIVDYLALKSIKLFLNDIKERLELLGKLEKIVKKEGDSND